MRALLTGGDGRRLRPLTNTMPGHLVPVANEPAIFYALRAIRDADITEVGLVVDRHGEELRHAVGDGSRFSLRVTYLPQDTHMGAGDAILIAREYLAGDDFVLCPGETVLLDGFVRLLKEFCAERPEALVAADRDGGPLGAYVLSPVIHQAVLSVRPGWRRERDMPGMLTWLTDHGYEVRTHRCSGYSRRLDGIDDVLDCNRTVLGTLRPGVRGAVDRKSRLSGPVVVDEYARVERSLIAGPAIIGPDAVVTGSRIGPHTTLGPDCVVVDAKVTNSILLAGARLHGPAGLADSVIGREAEIRADATTPDHVLRLVLGDHSRIGIGRRSDSLEETQ